MIDKLIAFMESLEWSGDNVTDICPICRRWKVQGHETNCELVDMLTALRTCDEHAKDMLTLSGQVVELTSALKAIHLAARGDAKGECWTIRKWMDARGMFNDDINGNVRLIEEAANYAVTRVEGR